MIYPSTQHSSDRRPYLQRPEDISETNANQLRGRYENVSLEGNNENIQASQGEVEGLALSYSHFADIFPHCLLPYLCMCGGRIRESG